MHTRLKALICAGVLLFTQATASVRAGEAGEAPPKIRIVALEGEVEVKQSGAEDWVPAKVGMALGQGDEIQTQLFSSVKLGLANNTTTTLDSMTRISVDKYIQDTETVSTRLRLRSGALSAVVNKGKRKSDFRVSSPQSTACVRGSELALFRTTPASMFGDTIDIERGRFSIYTAQLGRETVADAGQSCQVTDSSIVEPQMAAALQNAPDMLPAGSTGQERKQQISTRRFGDILPSDAAAAATWLPDIPVSAEPVPSSEAPILQGPPEKRSTVKPRRTYTATPPPPLPSP